MNIGDGMSMGMPMTVDSDDANGEKKCPFRDQSEPASDEVEEDIEYDDSESAEKEQGNNGGTLGKNIAGGSQGASGTWGGPAGYNKAEPGPEVPPNDTARASKTPLMLVPGAGSVPDGLYPFQVAAHHLIPGNASLGPSDLYDFLGKAGAGKLKAGGKSPRLRKDITAEGFTWKIGKLIGYNINGSHNGAWLPGNYALRGFGSQWDGRAKSAGGPAPDAHIAKASWSELGDADADWKLHYVAASVRVASGQFHDTHVNYSERVLGVLNKIATMLRNHLIEAKRIEKESNSQVKCPCTEATEIAPPYVVKLRLYSLSEYLRGLVLTSMVQNWSFPWMTSDHWSMVILGSGRKNVSAFAKAWSLAKRVE